MGGTVNSLAARIAVASSRVRPFTSGTGLVFGPSDYDIDLVGDADVWLGDGIVVITRPWARSYCPNPSS